MPAALLRPDSPDRPLHRNCCGSACSGPVFSHFPSPL
ncbi:MAG: hypothetical protein HFI66_04315 [Lachnospiraceae bacterium]|nr:hypothetical protein [Lachnospiraceae bacterium]